MPVVGVDGAISLDSFGKRLCIHSGQHWPALRLRFDLANQLHHGDGVLVRLNGGAMLTNGATDVFSGVQNQFTCEVLAGRRFKAR